MNKTVIVFGNPDLPMDSLPLRLVPELKKQFLETTFLVLDPNEEWPEIDDFAVIDTVQGIEKVTVFGDLSKFTTAPRLSMHDFDALAYMLYLRKLGKIKNVKIIGVPPDIETSRAVRDVSAALKPFLP